MPSRLSPSVVVIAAFTVGSAFAGPAEPAFSPTGPDAAAYGEAQGYPVPPKDYPYEFITQAQIVGHYSHFDQVRNLRPVAKGGTVSALRRAPAGVRRSGNAAKS